MDMYDYVEELGWLGKMFYTDTTYKPDEPPSEDWLLEEEEWPYD